MGQNEIADIGAILSPMLVFVGVVVQIFYNNRTKRKERDYEKRDEVYVAFLTTCNELVVDGKKLFEQEYYATLVKSYFMVMLYAPKKLQKIITQFKNRLDKEYSQYSDVVNEGIWDFNIQKALLLEYDYPTGEHEAKVDNDIWNGISESQKKFYEEHVIEKKEIETYIISITSEMSKNK